MRFDVITIFPEMFSSFLQTSIVARAVKKKIIKIELFDLRSVTKDKHRSVDGRPYGGGPGMVLRVDVMDRALKKVLKQSRISRSKTKIILLTPQGKVFNQSASWQLAKASRLILVCGHYEGFDERIRYLVDEEVSIGDYVLTGGELPAMALIDSISRNLPGFLGKKDSLSEESFSIDVCNSTFAIHNSLLEYPQYTRPAVYNSQKVPDVLQSGNHNEIKKWRMDKALERTKKRRPDIEV